MMENGVMPSTQRKQKFRNRKFVWPNLYQWELELAENLKPNKQAIAALRKIAGDGCHRDDLMHFLYFYTFSPITVFPEYTSRRDKACDGLQAIEFRFDSLAQAVEKLLNTKWRPEPTFGDFLSGGRFDVVSFSGPSTVALGKMPLVFFFGLPKHLQEQSKMLKQLREGLRKCMSGRNVGRSIYLAEFVIYLAAVTKKPIPWKEIADLINVARPKAFKELHTDPALLKKNLASFRRRNQELCQQAECAVAAYLTANEALSPKDWPPFKPWSSLKTRSAKR